jgi:DNA-binding LytR/AlgR family response regulator
MDKISCIVVEDNLIDAAYLNSFISQCSFLDKRADFGNALAAAEYIRQSTPRLIFMDIDMPGINGMAFFKMIDPPPLCIFVTAHSEYAWEGFESQAFDFILKPVKEERFANSMERLKEYLQLCKRADIYDSQIEGNTIIVKEGTGKHIINVNDILYIEALKDYSKVITSDKKIMTLSKLKHFIDKLPPGRFARIHRSYAVAINKIRKIESNDLFIDDIKLPIGKTYKNTLKLSV